MGAEIRQLKLMKGSTVTLLIFCVKIPHNYLGGWFYYLVLWYVSDIEEPGDEGRLAPSQLRPLGSVSGEQLVAVDEERVREECTSCAGP